MLKFVDFHAFVGFLPFPWIEKRKAWTKKKTPSDNEKSQKNWNKKDKIKDKEDKKFNENRYPETLFSLIFNVKILAKKI